MFEYIRFLIVETFKSPRDAIGQVTALDVDDEVWWLTGAVASLVPVVMQVLILTTFRSASFDLGSSLMTQPLVLGAIQLASFAVFVLLGQRIGWMFGGQAPARAILAAAAWITILSFVIQIAQTVVLFIFPPFAAFVTLVGVAWLTYVMGVFLHELHGFKDLATVIIVMIFVLFSTAFVLLIILIALGFSPELGVTNA